MRVALLKFLASAGLLAAGLGLATIERNGDGTWVPPGLTPGGPPRILQFYASTGTVEAGQPARICYGVANTKTVRISPIGLPLLPSARRCLTVAPRHTTHYTLMAEGFDGTVRVQSFTLDVQRPEPAPPQDLQLAYFLWQKPGDGSGRRVQIADHALVD